FGAGVRGGRPRAAPARSQTRPAEPGRDGTGDSGARAAARPRGADRGWLARLGAAESSQLALDTAGQTLRRASTRYAAYFARSRTGRSDCPPAGHHVCGARGRGGAQHGRACGPTPPLHASLAPNRAPASATAPRRERGAESGTAPGGLPFLSSLSPF